jgi:hypothetical protein
MGMCTSIVSVSSLTTTAGGMGPFGRSSPSDSRIAWAVPSEVECVRPQISMYSGSIPWATRTWRSKIQCSRNRDVYWRFMVEVMLLLLVFVVGLGSAVAGIAILIWRFLKRNQQERVR